MHVDTLVLGPIAENCYIVSSDSREAVVIDPGYFPEEILDRIEKTGVTVKAILITHGHSDHIGALKEIKEALNVPVYCTAEDAYRLPLVPDVCITDGDLIEEGGLQFQVVFTPGHTEGGVCYICDDGIFTGDTLFFRTIGRTDFPGGNFDVLRKSLQKLKNLPHEELRVYPGHDRASWLSEERLFNPFLNGNY